MEAPQRLTAGQQTKGGDTLEPFFDSGGITIYHADCSDILPLVPTESVDLLLADPPYGMAYNPETSGRISASLIESWQRYGGWAKDYAPIVGDDGPFDPAPLLAFGAVVLFGANYYADRLPPNGCWIVWDKKRGGTVTPGWNSSDAELAWTTFGGGVKVFQHLWAGYKRDSELGDHWHPTQKPVALMKWIIGRWTKPGDLVFDPYMGSGPIAQACHETGRRYIGVEIVEEYCETAVKRLAQQVLF